MKDVARGVVDERGRGPAPSAPSAAVFVVNVVNVVAVVNVAVAVAWPTGSEVGTTRSDGTGPGIIAGP